MKSIFDFLFYWIYSYRMSKLGDPEDATGKACFALTLIQLLLLYDLIMLTRWFFPFTLSIPKLAFVAIVLSIGFLLERLNLRHYRCKVQSLMEKYKNHSANRWFRIWMYFVIYFGLFFLPFIMSSLAKLLIA